MSTTGATPALLRKLLLELAQQDAARADEAQAGLQAATDRYLSSKPYLDSDGPRFRPGISEDRAAVRKVEQKATGPTLGDQTIIADILASEDAESFKRFQTGDWRALGYASQSEGDLALAGLLARHGATTAEQLDSLFRSTGMLRDKWDGQRQRGVARSD
jgi:primase-polymerase (primpol)-like protein